MFCPKCGAILKPKKDGKKTVFKCSCGYVQKDAEPVKLSEKMDKQTKDVEIIEEDDQTLPKTTVTCPKCGNNEAHYWTVQTRSSDEAETRFFKCTKCKTTWREAT